MDHIQDVYKKKPDMINKIWDHLTKVNLKVDGKPFQVVYNEDEDELEYHGRSGNETKVGPLIDDMYRLFSKPINDAIRHIENRVEVFKRYKFLTFEVIDEILLLTAIITKEGKFVDDPDEIDEIAKELDTDVMPCLWKGKISDEQRDILMTAISTDIVPTKDDFVKWVKDLFGTYKKFPKTLISRSTEFIEGIVFFYDVDGKVVEYKLVDPSFRQMVKDNHANMKQDGIENAEKYTEIYTSFLNWAEENAKGLDKNRMRSIEFNFIEMMKDPKIYNKLMKDGAGLTTITTDAYFLQPDRISDELKKAIKKHGKVYQLLYEKFVRLFYKAKKRGFVLSKEFQTRVNKAVEKFADYTLDEDMIEIDNIIVESENGKAYCYVLFEDKTYWESLEEISNIENFDDYFIYLDKIFHFDNDAKTLIKKLYDKWVSDKGFNKEPVYIPLRWNINKQIKIHSEYSDITGKDHEEHDKVGNLSFYMGKGSVKDLDTPSTSDQELGTCQIWNQLISLHKKNNEFNVDDITLDEILSIVININDKFNKKENKSWLTSYKTQFSSLYRFLQKESKHDLSDYTMFRYGVGNENDPGMLYKKLVETYILVSESGNSVKKDTYDPSDVIIVTSKGKKKLLTIYNKISSEIDISNYKSKAEIDEIFQQETYNKCIKILDEYRETFNDRDIMGISLKKCKSSGNAEFFNINRDYNCSTSEIKFNSSSDNATTLECIGEYNFSGISNPENNSESLKRYSKVYVCLRSNGSKQSSFAMDVKLESKNGPALGKVPVASWRKTLNVSMEDNKIEQRKKFEKYFCSNTSEVLNQMTELIQKAAKSGPWCLPYILIH